MQVQQVNFKSNQFDSKQVLPLEEIKPHLLIAFGAPNFFSQSDFFKKLEGRFSNSQILGCSTAGEISEDGVSLESCVLTAIHFDKEPKFKTASARFAQGSDPEETGKKLGEQLKAPDLKSIFILSLGVGINGSALIKGIQSAAGTTQILTGGLAADYGAFKKTYTLLNGEISSDSVIAIGFYGDHIHFGYSSRGGWETFGAIRRVTKAKENILFELDGQSALEVYKKYLGDKAKDLPASGLLYPLAILNEDQTNSGVVRTILGIDEKVGSLVLAGDIQEGGRVQLMQSTYAGLVSGARTAATEAKNMSKTDNNSLGILISCIGRRLVMQDDIVEEVDAVKEVFGSKSIVTGFYSNGEIAPFQQVKNCKLHNQTMTITYLTEE